MRRMGTAVVRTWAIEFNAARCVAPRRALAVATGRLAARALGRGVGSHAVRAGAAMVLRTRSAHNGPSEVQTAAAELVSSIQDACSSCTSAEQAIEKTLNLIGDFIKMPVVHAYQRDATFRTVLIPSGIWSEESKKYKEFVDITHRTEFREGIGLPGTALKTKSIVWYDDCMTHKNFPRNRHDVDLELHAAVACPVFDPQWPTEVALIIECLSPEYLVQDPVRDGVLRLACDSLSKELEWLPYVRKQARALGTF